MPALRKVRTKEWLESVGAVDKTERPVRSVDFLDIKCANCKETISLRCNNILSNIKKRGFPGQCKGCFKKGASKQASSRTGDKNPFYGKKHSHETKTKIAKIKKAHANEMPKEELDLKMSMMRDAATKKYGGNPMKNEEVKGRHWDSTHTNKFIKDAQDRGLALAKKHGFSRFMSLASNEYWSVDRDTKAESQKRRLIENVLSKPDVLAKRAKGFGEYINNEERVEQTLEKLKKTCLELYGSENWMQSAAADEWVMNNPGKAFSSKAELEILEWVRSLDFDAAKSRKGGKEIDVFVSERNIGIEYNGLYWHSEMVKDDEYHADKTVFFAKRGISLIHVFEHEWRDRQEQVKSFLKSKLGKNENKTGARKIDFKWVDKKEVSDFVEKYHIQGYPQNTRDAIAGYHNGNIVVVATFSQHHRKAGTWVLNRFVGKEDWTIQGALSKMSKMAAGKYGELISWCDLRWSDGVGYENAGWVKDGVLKPDYFYTDFKGIVPKQSRKKKLVGTPEGMTEHEHAFLDGLFRVYDCGKIRYKFVNSK